MTKKEQIDIRRDCVRTKPDLWWTTMNPFRVMKLLVELEESESREETWKILQDKSAARIKLLENALRWQCCDHVGNSCSDWCSMCKEGEESMRKAFEHEK